MSDVQRCRARIGGECRDRDPALVKDTALLEDAALLQDPVLVKDAALLKEARIAGEHLHAVDGGFESHARERLKAFDRKQGETACLSSVKHGAGERMLGALFCRCGEL